MIQKPIRAKVIGKISSFVSLQLIIKIANKSQVEITSVPRMIVDSSSMFMYNSFQWLQVLYILPVEDLKNLKEKNLSLGITNSC